MTVTEAAKLIGVSRQQVRNLVRAGRLVAVSLVRPWRLDEASVEQMASQRRSEPPRRPSPPPTHPWRLSKFGRARYQK